jgi:hypothetical protein
MEANDQKVYNGWWAATGSQLIKTNTVREIAEATWEAALESQVRDCTYKELAITQAIAEFTLSMTDILNGNIEVEVQEEPSEESTEQTVKRVYPEGVTRFKWTQEELQYLESRVGTHVTTDEIARRLNRTDKAIRSKVHSLGYVLQDKCIRRSNYNS